MRVIVFAYRSQSPPSTFVQRHVDHIAGGVSNFMQLKDWAIPMLGNRPLWNVGLAGRVWRRLRRTLGATRERLHRDAFATALRRAKPDAVLAEFGYSGVHILEPCRQLGIPLFVHFHGTDINRKELLDSYQGSLPQLFEHATALVTVSENERHKLVALGAAAERVHVIPCGAVIAASRPEARRSADGYRILSITRMSEVKAPHLVLVAFQRFLELGGTGVMHMVGDGPLLPFCISLAKGLAIADRCVFHGAVPHPEVMRLVGQSDLYVQHSIIARDGDCEGMPVSLMEAAGHGLPIVTTAPGGIGEHFVNQVNSCIVGMYDTTEMARQMHALFTDRDKAGRLGRAAYALARERFDANMRSEEVAAVIRAHVTGGRRGR
jgi:glycosyltransferase involved in cell wall biosynthesis